MSYFRASTSNPLGWRPGTVRLGTLNDRAPDWKHAAAMHDHARRVHQARSQAVHHARTRQLMRLDAYARGDRSTLKGLAGLDLNTPMVLGARYVFHFTYSGFGMDPDPINVQDTVTADSNFKTPVAAQEPGGMQVAFIYNGRGSTVGDAGREMQNILASSSYSLTRKNMLFSSAEGGPVGQAASPVTTDGTVLQYPDGSVVDTTTGVIYNADGTVRSTAGTAPGAAAGTGSGSSLATFLSGARIGTIALILGGLYLFRQ